MTYSTPETFAIYQTRQGIALCKNQNEMNGAELICLVSHYQSAVRIARQAAAIRQQPVVTYMP